MRRRRHVLGDRAVPAAAMRASVAGYPLMAEQYLDRGAGDPLFDLLADQGMGHRVVVVVSELAPENRLRGDCPHLLCSFDAFDADHRVMLASYLRGCGTR